MRPFDFTDSLNHPPFPGNSGPYAYDGSGNITAMGADVFAYDKVSRIVESTVSGQDQDYTYDTYGNIKTITTEGSLRNVPVDPSTNRLAGYDYDNRGNLRFWNAQECYEYDEFNQVKQVRSGSCTGPVDRAHVYTADGERILTVHGVADFDFTLRDLDGKVLRKFRTDPQTETTSISLDNIWLEGRLVGFVDEDGEEVHAHLDHLGTPRLHTDAAGAKLSEHDYFPFGLEITNPAQDEIPMKFTGHERDRSAIGTAAELDYMHARYYSPHWGRFTSVDPARRRKASKKPLSWNRYQYARDNPLNRADADGLKDYYFTFSANSGLTPESQARVKQRVVAKLTGIGGRDVRALSGRRGFFQRGFNVKVTGDPRRVNGGDAFGGRRSIKKQIEVSTAKAQGLSQDGLVNFVVNITLHERAHLAGLHPFDGLTGQGGPEGSITEQVVPATEENAAILGAEERDYTPEEAAIVAADENDEEPPPPAEEDDPPPY